MLARGHPRSLATAPTGKGGGGFGFRAIGGRRIGRPKAYLAEESLDRSQRITRRWKTEILASRDPVLRRFQPRFKPRGYTEARTEMQVAERARND